MIEMGRTLLIVGGVIAVVGSFLFLAGKARFNGLPGDVDVRSPHARFYFPIVSCLVLSAVLTLASWLFRWFQGR